MSTVRTQALEYDPTVTIGAYSANDVVGDLQGLSLGSVKGTGVIKSLKIIDIDNQKAAFTILIFKSEPASWPADNGAISLSAANAKLVIAKINVTAADYETIATRAIADIDLSKVIKAVGDKQGGVTDRKIWPAVITTGTPTYTTLTSLKFIFGLLLDN
jgi:hypothetical protein